MAVIHPSPSDSGQGDGPRSHRLITRCNVMRLRKMLPMYQGSIAVDRMS